MRKKTIAKIHESEFKFVIVSSGGGSNAIGSLLKVPGASNSILEAYIPMLKSLWIFILCRNLSLIAHWTRQPEWQLEHIVRPKRLTNKPI